ncbi:hypothetical protein CRG98_046333 [Punica granatum]|uniref:Uncharacterized protein n=1 Tax=Punica granatum TaxID=22663 RepID=A0A2I0HNK9_PUNGR|nr:hypothetical protein CRG98_046333 [Punica granatum]
MEFQLPRGRSPAVRFSLAVSTLGVAEEPRRGQTTSSREPRRGKLKLEIAAKEEEKRRCLRWWRWRGGAEGSGGSALGLYRGQLGGGEEDGGGEGGAVANGKGT